MNRKVILGCNCCNWTHEIPEAMFLSYVSFTGNPEILVEGKSACLLQIPRYFCPVCLNEVLIKITKETKL